MFERIPVQVDGRLAIPKKIVTPLTHIDGTVLVLYDAFNPEIAVLFKPGADCDTATRRISYLVSEIYKIVGKSIEVKVTVK